MGKKDTSVADLPRTASYSRYKQLKITLPGQAPSINHMYYNTRGGGKNLTSQALDYMRRARALVNLSMEEQRWSITPKGVWLYIDFVFYFPDKRRRDSHNCLKLLMDILQEYVYEDDMYVLPRIQSVEYDKENPRVEMAVSLQSSHQREKGLQLTK